MYSFSLIDVQYAFWPAVVWKSGDQMLCWIIAGYCSERINLSVGSSQLRIVILSQASINFSGKMEVIKHNAFCLQSHSFRETISAHPHLAVFSLGWMRDHGHTHSSKLCFFHHIIVRSLHAETGSATIDPQLSLCLRRASTWTTLILIFLFLLLLFLLFSSADCAKSVSC